MQKNAHTKSNKHTKKAKKKCNNGVSRKTLVYVNVFQRTTDAASVHVHAYTYSRILSVVLKQLLLLHGSNIC